MTTEKTKVIYRIKPFYLWFAATAISVIAVPIISSQGLDYIQLIVWAFIILLVGHFSIKEVVFGENEIRFNYPMRIFLRKKIMVYNTILYIEIRNRKEPYQRPYIILHFDEAKINNKFIWHRSGIYKSTDELIPLIRHLCKKEVKIKLNMTVENKNEYEKLYQLINKSDGKNNSNKSTNQNGRIY